MKKEEFKDARRYRLTRNVTNPQLDRRERYDVSKLAWSLGDVFRARVRDGELSSLHAVYIEATPRRASHYVFGSHPGFDALVDALIELPETSADICERYSVSQKEVLQDLVRRKILTLEQVEEACSVVASEPDPE